MQALKQQDSIRFKNWIKGNDILLPFGIFGVVALLVLPVSPAFMDLLLALSIGISLMTLLIVIYVKEPSEFSIFPVTLLAATLYRLGLNVASTRLILLDGYAGRVIESFGDFVVRGNYVVGGVVFLILVVINFMVITKGAGRIAEVAARFTLDAMPGKQMAIDAELNAGLIDEKAATRRRIKIQKEADFYGAMDGASKFVRGDAVAGLIITFINIVGGICIGVLQKGLALNEALARYTLLSIGDGLVAQIPALIISVAAGMLITRTGEGSDLNKQFSKQLRVHPKAMFIVAAMLFVLAIMPAMAFWPFFILSIALMMGARSLQRKGYGLEKSKQGSDGEGLVSDDDSMESVATDLGGKPRMLLDHASKTPHAGLAQRGAGMVSLEKMIQTDPFAIELGYSLLGLADPQQGGDLLDRVNGVRQKFARDVGVIIPAISIRDSIEIESKEYRFLVRNKEVARGEIMPNAWLAMNASNSDFELKGTPTLEPVFGIQATWIREEERQNAEIHAYTVVDTTSVLVTHLSEILNQNLHLLLEREDVQKLVNIVKEKNPTLVSELLPDHVTVGLIQRVLQNLLKEKIPIKNLTVILETIGDFASMTKNPDDLSEQVRRRLGIYFSENYEYRKGVIRGLTLNPRLEQLLISKIKRSQFEVGLVLSPDLTQEMLNILTPAIQKMSEQGLDPIIITTGELRLPFKRFFEPSFSKMVVLSYQELPNDIHIQSIGVLGSENIETAVPSKLHQDLAVGNKEEQDRVLSNAQKNAIRGIPDDFSDSIAMIKQEEPVLG